MAKWTSEEIDMMLERVLPLSHPKLFERAVQRLANELCHTVRKDVLGRSNTQSIERQIWGLATNYKKTYTPVNRTSRVNLEWSYVEDELLKLAKKTKSDHAKAFRKLYEDLAVVLQRHPKEVKDRWNKKGPAKGFPGLLDDV